MFSRGLRSGQLALDFCTPVYSLEGVQSHDAVIGDNKWKRINGLSDTRGPK
ncbi:hypothetical protein MBT84_47010 [Streptomyces sp. MBT84]|nr:hypothetical protein [Streptomyces sp. MBT84]